MGGPEKYHDLQEMRRDMIDRNALQEELEMPSTKMKRGPKQKPADFRKATDAADEEYSNKLYDAAPDLLRNITIKHLLQQIVRSDNVREIRKYEEHIQLPQ